MDTSEALDLSKENIQPLVHGRKTDKLTTALQVNSNFQLQQELKRHREEFELKIRLYNGEDPLQIRFDYVQWLEQSYPNLGPETNIIQFLEETLAEFKNIEEYKQDPRYVSLVIKYIETQPNPLEIFNLVYNENIGTKLSIFYKAWADKLDTYGNIKQANHVFQLGLNAEAQPREELEAAQMNFQLSVGRRFLIGGTSEEQQAPPQEEPQRQVLGKLKKVAPGMTRLKKGEAGQMSQHTDSKKPLHNVTTNLNVYIDPCEDGNSYSKEPSLQNSHFKIKATTLHKENTKAPGVWTKKKTKKFATPIPSHPGTPSFPIHMDEGCDGHNAPPASVQVGSALKTKKSVEDSAPYATGLFESASSGREGYMFCKNKMFLGKSELQIEEFRGAKYRMEKYGTCQLPVIHRTEVPRIHQEADVSQQKKKPPKEDDIPVNVPEPVDKTKVPMYRKQQVYIGGNKEVQLEELRAIHYRNKPMHNAAHWPEEVPVCVPCYSEKTKCIYPKSEIYIGNNREIQLEELRAVQYRARKMTARNSRATPLSRGQCKSSSSAIDSDEMEEKPLSQLGKVPSFVVPTEDSPKDVQTSFFIYSDDKSQDSNPRYPISQSKALTFSTSEDESLEKKNKSSGSAKKLGLFDSPEKDVLCNANLYELIDESQQDMCNIFDDMWKSPAVNKTKASGPNWNHHPTQSPRLELPKQQARLELPKQEVRLDVSDFTVNTKEALQLVHDWWSSPSSNCTATSNHVDQKRNNDVTFKKPVSTKKPPPVPSTTPFKIYSEETDSDPVPPKTPYFEIFTDEDPVPIAHIAPLPSKTPPFEVFTDEDPVSGAHIAPFPARTPSFKVQTSAFEIFTEEELADPESDLVVAPPKTPKFPIFCDDSAPPAAKSASETLRTPKFEIYTSDNGHVTKDNGVLTKDNGELSVEQLSCISSPRSCTNKTSFNVFCDAPADPKQSQEKTSVLNSKNSEKKSPNILSRSSQHRKLDILEEDMLATPLGDKDMPEPQARQLLSLPYVAPAVDLDRQPLGGEFKENCLPGNQFKHHKRSLENQRVLNGYLVPSSVPINVPEEDEYEDEVTDMTCNTRAFNFALPSSTSTPLCSGSTRRSTSYGVGNHEINGSFLQEPAPAGLNLSYKTQCETLSVILEASKEKSSSSSGSSGYSGVSGAPSSYFHSSEKKPFMKHAVCQDKTTSGLEDSVASLHMNKIDPFDEEVIDDLLSQKVQFPLARHRVGYECFFSELHSLKVNSHTSLGNAEYTILKELGKGAYARVLMGKTSSDTKVALKQQKPACVWEWYICKEIENRLKPTPSALAHFVLPHHIYVFKNSSVLASPWAKFGNLLDLVNVYKIKKGKSLNIQACLKLNLEMTQAVHALHKINIIHGDIKPDNFVICNLMKGGLPTLKLIDYGRGIDLSLFPPGTTFNSVVTTDGFQCTEMKEGRDWTYHTDVYGLAGSMCCTLLGKYMSTVKRGDKWSLADTIPRYLRRDLMEPIFETLLNLPLHYEISTLESIRVKLEAALKISLAQSDEGLQCVDDILNQLKLM